MTPRKFKSLRKKARMTQRQLAAILGKTQRQVANYESGKTPVPKLVAEKVAGGGWKMEEF